MKNWKNIYLAILTVITVGAIILGSFIHIGGFRFGGWGIGDDSAYRISYRSSLTEEETKLESFQAVEVTAEASHVVLERGDSWCLTSKADKNDEVTYEIEDGILKVNERRKRLFRFFPFFRNPKSGILTITVPKDMDLTKADFRLDMGNITVRDMTVDQINVHAEMGGVNVSGCVAKDATLDTEMGSVHVQDSELTDAFLKTEMGSIKAETVDFTTMRADTEMGSVDITLKSPVKELDLELSTQMGSVHLDGEKVAKSYEQKGNTGKKLTAKTEMGSVHVRGSN